MTNLSKELCEVCGIEPKCINCGRTVSEDNPCPKPCSEQKYPDFTKLENFAKLFSLVTTIDAFVYAPECINAIKAFLECVIECAVKEKNIADCIKRTEWVYD